MKPNRFRQLLAQGKAPVGHMLFEFNTRGMAQILETAGVDFVVIDMEHSSFTIDDLANMVAWLKATHVAPFVRIPQIQYHFIARALDAGVLGVVAPNVRSSAAAHDLVDAAKYPPLGKRGCFFGGASSDFRKDDPDSYFDFANQNTTVVCMIESPEGVDDLEQIAATPGVDALWVGHWDLSQYMGIRGQFEHPRFLEAVERVTDAAHRNNLAAMVQPVDLNQIQKWMQIGFNVFSYDADFYVYQNALTQAVGGLRRALEE